MRPSLSHAAAFLLGLACGVVLHAKGCPPVPVPADVPAPTAPPVDAPAKAEVPAPAPASERPL